MLATQHPPQEAYQAPAPPSPTTAGYREHQEHNQSSHSPSPSRSRSGTRAKSILGDKITALGARLSRTLGHASVGEDSNDASATATPDDASSVYSNGEPKYTGQYSGRGSFSLGRRRTLDSDASGATAVVAGNGDRSVSRGREVYSTGRGGAGNIRQPSFSSPNGPPNGRTGLGPDDFSVTRGREPVPFGGARGVSPNANGVYSTGRGGAGNLRSPSRDGSGGRAAVNAGVVQDEQIIREYVEKQVYEGVPFSTGRGGAGNITSRSRSKSQTRDSAPPSTRLSHNQIFSTGRGGAGNIVSGDISAADHLDEDERRRVATHSPSRYASNSVSNQVHSTGRGGGGNITTQPVPPVEQQVFEERGRARGAFESHGRGGAGNIAARGQTPAQTRDRSVSAARD